MVVGVGLWWPGQLEGGQRVPCLLTAVDSGWKQVGERELRHWAISVWMPLASEAAGSLSGHSPPGSPASNKRGRAGTKPAAHSLPPAPSCSAQSLFLSTSCSHGGAGSEGRKVGGVV